RQQAGMPVGSGIWREGFDNGVVVICLRTVFHEIAGLVRGIIPPFEIDIDRVDQCGSQVGGRRIGSALHGFRCGLFRGERGATSQAESHGSDKEKGRKMNFGSHGKKAAGQSAIFSAMVGSISWLSVPAGAERAR